MKNWITATILVNCIAVPVAAESISVSVGIVPNAAQGSNVASLDQCNLRIDATNGTPSSVEFTAFVMPTVIPDSFSSYTFGILNEDPVPVPFSSLSASQTASADVSFQALDCNDIEFVSIEPVCDASDCGDLVIVESETVLDVVLPNAPLIKDVGPLHGSWGVFAEDGVQYLSVFIDDDTSGEFTAHLTTQSAFCGFVGAGTGCPQGQLDKSISQISGDTDRMFMILNLTDNLNKDQVELTINTNAGTGQLANPSAIKFESIIVQRVE